MAALMQFGLNWNTSKPRAFRDLRKWFFIFILFLIDQPGTYRKIWRLYRMQLLHIQPHLGGMFRITALLTIMYPFIVADRRCFLSTAWVQSSGRECIKMHSSPSLPCLPRSLPLSFPLLQNERAARRDSTAAVVRSGTWQQHRTLWPPKGDV